MSTNLGAGEDLREAIAKAALDAASYHSDGDPWVDEGRIPDGADPDDYYESGMVEWDHATDDWRSNGYRIADAVLAVLTQRGERTVAADVVEAIRWVVDESVPRSTDTQEARHVVRAWLDAAPPAGV